MSQGAWGDVDDRRLNVKESPYCFYNMGILKLGVTLMLLQ